MVMKVIFSTNVKEDLKEYAKSLKNYPISKERAKDKRSAMIASLKKVGLNPTAFPICRYKNLGQALDANRNPLNSSLRQYTYVDESKFKWCFSYINDESTSTITFIKMMAAIHVKESFQGRIDRIINETLNRFLKNSLIKA